MMNDALLALIFLAIVILVALVRRILHNNRIAREDKELMAELRRANAPGAAPSKGDGT